MTALFTVRTAIGSESFAVDYESVDSALHDTGLKWMMRDGAAASVWSGNLRVTRDLTTWETLRAQLVANATTLLRGDR